MSRKIFQIKTSCFFYFAFYFLIGMTFFVVLFFPYSAIVKSIALITLTLYSWFLWKVVIKKNQNYLLTFTQNKGWQIEKTPIIILGSTTITRFLIVLNFKMKNNFKTILIFRDSLSLNDFNQLITLLKFS